jgi:dolichyl-phosphate beta-glucosyltransferase
MTSKIGYPLNTPFFRLTTPITVSSLSIVIPAYNEEQRLPKTLDSIVAYLAGSDFSSVEILIVDDGSKDGTARLVEAYRGTDGRIRLLRNPGNRGKGYSVRHGMLEAKGEWVLFSDADLSAPIEDLDTLLGAAAQHDAAIVIGSRAVDRSMVGVRQSLWREISGRTFNLFMRTATGLPHGDTQCGFKLYRQDAARAVFSRQTLDAFSFDVEDLVIARQLGLRTVEIAVRWNNVEGTTVSTLQGIKSFLDLARIRWNQAAGKYN